MLIRELTNKEFDDFINNHNSSLYQTKEYAFTMNRQNFDSMFIGMINGDEIVAASLILIEKKSGFKYAYAPRGFIMNFSDSALLKAFTEELKKFLSKKDVTAIKLCPPILKNDPNYNFIYDSLKNLNYWHFGYNLYFEALKPRFEAVINMDKPYYELFNNIKKEFRTKIRSASNKGVVIHKGNETNLDLLYDLTKKKYVRDLKYFKDIYHYFGENKKVDFYYAKLDTKIHLDYIKKRFELLEEENEEINKNILDYRIVNNSKDINKKIESDNALSDAKKDLILATNLLSKHPNGIILASALIVKHKKEVYLLMDGYDKMYTNFNAKHLLIWKMIEKYSQAGYTKFNLGGITGPGIADNKFAGLNDFKLNFNAETIEYMGDLELIINQAKYFMLKKALPIASILKK